jgi:hypothetical protein
MNEIKSNSGFWDISSGLILLEVAS